VADGLTHSQEIAVNKVLAGTETGKQLIEQFPSMATELNTLAKEALVSGMQTAYVVVGVLAFLGLLVATFFVGGRLRRHRAEQEASAEARASA
jgi:hypothetical protein